MTKPQMEELIVELQAISLDALDWMNCNLIPSDKSGFPIRKQLQIVTDRVKKSGIENVESCWTETLPV